MLATCSEFQIIDLKNSGMFTVTCQGKYRVGRAGGVLPQFCHLWELRGATGGSGWPCWSLAGYLVERGELQPEAQLRHGRGVGR